jgi:hypothetical protein
VGARLLPKSDLPMHEIGSECGESIELSVSPATVQGKLLLNGLVRLQCNEIVIPIPLSSVTLSVSAEYWIPSMQPAGCWPKNGITAAAANPEILPLEFLLGDEPVHGSLSGWIAQGTRSKKRALGCLGVRLRQGSRPTAAFNVR